MRVKICGLTRADDAFLAVELGATDLGFVLAPDSPRRTSPAFVRGVARDLPAAVRPVLVLRAATRDEALSAVEESGVREVQLHAFKEADAAALERTGVAVRRAHRLDAARTPPTAAPDRIVVLDGGRGGEGRLLDLSRLRPRAPAWTFLAGGVRPENLDRFLALLPFGLDVCSGVERSPGEKDPARLVALFERLAAAHTRKDTP